MNLRNCFERISEKLNGAITDDAMDFADGTSFYFDELEELYELYNEIEDEIDSWIEENDLDDVANEEAIKEHFTQYEEYFCLNQACLIDFEKFVISKLNK